MDGIDAAEALVMIWKTDDDGYCDQDGEYKSVVEFGSGGTVIDIGGMIVIFW